MNQQLTRPGTKSDIREAVEKMGPQFAMALPKLLTAERFIRVALTCINKNPKLLQCTRDSLLACLLDCAQLGIEADGRRAHLIPFWDSKANAFKCTLIIDYKGLAELVRRSGEVSTLHAGIVYPGDDFDYQFGTGQYLKHKPTLNRGDEKPLAVYSYVKLKDGQEDFDVMGIEEVNKVRKRSKSANEGPWVTDYDEMAKKTVFRRHSKWLPLSPELREKIEKDDEPLTEQERFAAAKPVNAVSGIQFGPAMPSAEPNLPETGLSGAEIAENEPQPSEEGASAERPRRKRRTKAEMEAARSEKEMPPRATPLEGLRNLIAASPIDEDQLRRHLIQKMQMEPRESFDDLSDDRLTGINNRFTELCAEILEPAQDKAPY